MSLAPLRPDLAEPLWLYGIRRAGDRADFDAPPLPGGGPMGLISVGGIDLLAGVAPSAEVRRTRRNMLAHARALELAAAAAPVLPMRFGVIASAAAAAAAAAPREPELLARLDELTGLAEFGLRVAWSEAEAFAALAAARPDLVAERRRLESRGGAAREAMIDLGRRVSDAISDRRQAAQKALLRALTPQVGDHRLRAPESECEVLRMEILIPRAAEDAMLEAVREAAAGLSFAAGAPTIRWVGPSAPFNFVDIALDPAPVM